MQPSPPSRLTLSSPQRSFPSPSNNNATNYVPINPFLSDNHENFPPLDEEILYDDFEDEPEELFHNTSNVSLNLSIDTLAKIKPVDISNISDFLKEKQQEEIFEETQRSAIEREDSEYFKQRKEDLSPQSKKGKAVVLYSSFMDENNKQQEMQNDNLSFTPRKNFNTMDDEDEDEFSFSSPPQFMSPIIGENRREDFFFSPSKSSPKPGEIDISFLSPIRSGASDVPSSPLLTPENKLLKSISHVKTKDGEIPKKRVSVAKKLDFLQNESPTMDDETFGNSSLPITKLSPSDISNPIQHSSMIISGTNLNKFTMKEKNQEIINTQKKVSFHIVQTTQTTPEDLEISTSTNTSLTSTPTPIRDFSIQSIETRSVGIQTIMDNSKFSQTSPLHCPNCNHKFTLEHTDSTTLLFPENDSFSSTTTTTTAPLRSSRNINNTSTTLYSTPQSSRSYSHHTSQFSSYNTPSRYSFPTLVSSRIYTSYHQETHLISEHRKPLSPLNYALVKQRYKTQMRYLDKHTRNSFHLS